MSAKARARGAAAWLPVMLFLGFIAALAAVDAGATPERNVIPAATFAAGDTASPDNAGNGPENKPIVVALAVQSGPARIAPSAVPPQANIAPLMAPLPAPAPARFFTISEVMAKRAAGQNNLTRLASADATAAAIDTGAELPIDKRADGPFGLFTQVAPDGQIWTKWRKVADDIRAEEPALMRCLADNKQCSAAASQFGAIVLEARGQSGRARLDLVNQRVNAAIHYKSDMAQWGVADVWSPPLATNDSGSFNTGFGDCEDFAIAKYVALRAAGVPASQMRVLLVHDNLARLDHAVLAAQDDSHWYILDNRWMTAVEDSEVRQFTPLFALDEQGVKRLATPRVAEIQPMSEVVKIGKQKFVPGGELIEQAQETSSRELGKVGLRGSVL
jgi:predicted transglutaminase-like cysteine proteinase